MPCNKVKRCPLTVELDLAGCLNSIHILETIYKGEEQCPLCHTSLQCNESEGGECISVFPNDKKVQRNTL